MVLDDWKTRHIPISLVEDHHRDTVQVRGSHGEQVEQATGRCDQDLCSAIEIANLRSFGNTSVAARVANLRSRSELVALGLGLSGEFASGIEDEDDGAVAGVQKRLSVDVDHGGNRESKRLAGSSCGDATV